jgi:hypothetical protein
MSLRRPAVLALAVLFAIQSAAQQPPSAETGEAAQPQSVVRQPRAPKSDAVIGSASGDIFLENAPSPWGAVSGIFMRANTSALPVIAAKVGDSTTSAYFAVADTGNQVLFKVRAGDGRAGIGEPDPLQLLHLKRTQNAATGMHITNASTGAAASTMIGFNESSSLKAEISSAGSGNTAANGGANALKIWNYANAPMVFGTNSVEAMRIRPDGSLNIGTDVQGARLAVRDTRFGGGTALSMVHESTVSTNAADNDFGLYLRSHQAVAAGVTNSQGIVSSHNEAYNTAGGTIATIVGSRVRAGVQPNGPAGVVSSVFGTRIYVDAGNGTVTNGYALYIDNVQANNAWGVYQADSSDLNYFGGSVGIGTAPGAQYKLHVAGNANFDGTVTGTTIYATYQDVAEWVPALVDMQPGTVVVLNPHAINEVMPSSQPYDTSVAGVVAAQPGVLLGVKGDSKEQIATTGRVKVRVDATAGPIRVGDLLVTSTKPGVAMRSEPVDLNGHAFHKPGTILGKALEPLGGGEGEILVLLSMQ